MLFIKRKENIDLKLSKNKMNVITALLHAGTQRIIKTALIFLSPKLLPR